LRASARHCAFRGNTRQPERSLGHLRGAVATNLSSAGPTTLLLRSFALHFYRCFAAEQTKQKHTTIKLHNIKLDSAIPRAAMVTPWNQVGGNKLPLAQNASNARDFWQQQQN
jgi:hypothetical protein